MILIRSLIYLVYLYGTMTLVALAYLPDVLISGRKGAARAAHRWAKMALAGLGPICGIRHEVRGLENFPQGALLIACKHQSMWETLFFLMLFEEPAIVLKSELLKMPVYGWYARKLEMIAVDREQGAGAIKELARQAEKALADKRPIIIFPEGTRQSPGAPPDYKPGIALLYRQLGLPCVPAALNSGLYWAAHGPLRRHGKILVEFGAPIRAGLERKVFMAELEGRIEEATSRLIDEGESGRKPAPAMLQSTDA